MATAFHWTCPHCDRDTTITDPNVSTDNFVLAIENKDGRRYFKTTLIVCPNAKCKRFTFRLEMYVAMYGKTTMGWIPGTFLQSWNLIPPSQAKVFPKYVPQPILDDYTEACLIKDLSPKASATLSRRCLQGMIRDFWGIKEARLIDEIKALKGKTDDTTWKAIDATREIGNIGAHMEKDINVIVDVDPEEAQLLIGLIEYLVKAWYVERYEKEQHLAEILKVQAEKKAAKTAATTPAAAATPATTKP
jgi:Domain of unknown function (DUF4145)